MLYVNMLRTLGGDGRWYRAPLGQMKWSDDDDDDSLGTVTGGRR